MDYVAASSGAWSSPQTWGGSSIPGPTDTIQIPAGITVSINSPSKGANPYPAIVQLMNGGSLTVEGTLAINVAATPFDSHTTSGLATFQGASVTIKPGGVLNITATGNTGPGATYNATGIWACYNSQISNQGTININCHNLNGGLGFGILLDDPGVTLTNAGTIAIQATDPAKDGRGHCYGLRLRPGCLQNSGLITTSAETAGSIKVEGGTFNNAGRFVNRGVLANGGSINNTGSITHVYPGAALQGGGVAGAGRINLSGTAPQAVSLDSLGYGVNTYHVAANDTLQIAGNLTVPAPFILSVSGAVSVSGTVTNDGGVHYNLPGASYSGQAIQGTGKVNLKGQVIAASSLDLGGLGAAKYHIALNETFHVGGTLTIPTGVTLKTDSWGKVQVLASGLIDNKGTLSNAGFIVNGGTIRHWLPGATFTGSATTASGVTALAGTVNAALSVNSFGAPELNGAVTYQVLATDTLIVTDTLTVPQSCTLVVNGGIDSRSILQNNGAITNNGYIKYRLPAAAYSGTGTYTGAGVIYLSGSTPDSLQLDLGALKGNKFEVCSGDLLMVTSGGMQLPAGCSLTNSGVLNLRARCFVAGSLTNAGEIDGAAWLVHVLPTASYLQTTSGSFRGQSVGLMGSITADCGLDGLGYPATVTQFFAQWSLTVNATLTIPKGYLLYIDGTAFGGSGTIDTGSSGTLACALPEFLTFGFTGDVTGTGPVALGGTIKSSDTFGTLNTRLGRTSFLIMTLDYLQIQADVTFPDGFALTNEGMLSVVTGCSLTLGDPPAKGVGAINNKGAFMNDGTLTITNSLAQKYGIYCSGAGASFSNTGTINIKNTAGVGMRFDKSVGNLIFNGGTITISGTYSGTPTVESAAIANQVTLDNSQGTIAAPAGNASIYNSGTISGGTYTGQQPTPNAWKAS